MKEQKPKLTIFKNDKAGQPIKRKDGTEVSFNGKPMLQPSLNGKISLPEGLPAGDYEIGVYQYESQKGLKYYSGTIKPVFKKVDSHSTDKANGYNPAEKKINLNDFDDDDLSDLGVPF